jgi:hypothetical protein
MWFTALCKDCGTPPARSAVPKRGYTEHKITGATGDAAPGEAVMRVETLTSAGAVPVRLVQPSSVRSLGEAFLAAWD